MVTRATLFALARERLHTAIETTTARDVDALVRLMGALCELERTADLTEPRQREPNPDARPVTEQRLDQAVASAVAGVAEQLLDQAVAGVAEQPLDQAAGVAEQRLDQAAAGVAVVAVPAQLLATGVAPSSTPPRRRNPRGRMFERGGA